MNWSLRLAKEEDIPSLQVLIPLSVRSLQAPYYSSAQIEAALGPVFGIDRQLLGDGNYFVAEQEGQIIGCGGWSKRRSLFGGDESRGADVNEQLDPKRDPARIRAFFVHPQWARRGIGRSILAACETAILEAHFQNVELVATLAGAPLYASCAYVVVERYQIPMPGGGLSLPVVRMIKPLNRR